MDKPYQILFKRGVEPKRKPGDYFDGAIYAMNGFFRMAIRKIISKKETSQLVTFEVVDVAPEPKGARPAHHRTEKRVKSAHLRFTKGVRSEAQAYQLLRRSLKLMVKEAQRKGHHFDAWKIQQLLELRVGYWNNFSRHGFISNSNIPADQGARATNTRYQILKK